MRSTTAWDVNYVAVDAFRRSEIVTEAHPSVALVGAVDNTTVTILGTAAIAGGPSGGSPPGVSAA